MSHSDVRLPNNFAPKGYEPLERLHEGRYSLVYRALQSEDQTAVIIKTTPPQVALRLSDHLAFRNQFTISQDLDHPGTLQILGLEPCNHSYALIMEDVQGIALSTFLQTAVSLKDGLTIALQLAEILHYLSQKRILHKDIKPANILIHPQTLQVTLIDFGIASRLPKEIQNLKNPQVLEGSLAYMAPEQTGRMNRGIDFRSDFYGLGITLFELFSGQLPFQADEPMGWLHCHIAQEPPSLTEFGVPTAVAHIVAKLLAKNAEDRYQSALGLKDDLGRCLAQLTAQGDIEPFEVGQNDVCDRFLIPEKLYGRDADVQTLLNAFDRVTQGTSELMLIAGVAGIGKTALVNQVHLPIAQHKGFFIKGKFDQFNRNVPFFAWVQALQELIKQLLSESDSTLANWKAKILAGVGEQGQVLIEVIPELALILGPQPAVPELSGVAAQNRFNRLFGQLIQVFTTHPLVIFLDDLQWADAASLNLLKRLMTGTERGYLFVLGAYRENEVSPVHPLTLTLKDLQASEKTFQTLALEPLQPQTIFQLVADSLHCSVESATPLAQLVHQKTQGNPFFTTQFLQGLQADGWITFNADAGYWECDLSQIRSLALTDDVVEFMVNRLQQLPPKTQNMLAISACLGNSFKLDTLAVVCEQSPETLAHDLWPALQSGLIIPENETYKLFQTLPDQPVPELTTPLEVSVTYRFLHDRGQQAAYALIPVSQKHQTHYRMGQFLLDHLPPEKQEKSLFNIVNQLNIGRDLITAAEARHQLISLNLRAGMKAKAATAYRAALDYFDIAIDLLSAEGWHQHYPLALALHDHAAEAAYLVGDQARMDALIQTVTHQAQSCLDTVNTVQVKMLSCLGQNQPLVSIEIAYSLLQDLGVVLPDSPTLEEVKQELNTFKQLAAPFSFDQIAALPTLTDPKELAIISTLMLMISPTMITNPNLFFWIALVANKLFLESGNTPYSACGYLALAILFKKLEQDIDVAYAWGNLSLQLLHTPHGEILGNRVYQSMGAFILHGKRHVEETLSVLQQAYTSSLDTGDFEFVGYALMVKCYNLYFLGRELSEVQQAIRQANDALSDLGQNLPLSWNQCCYRSIIQLSNAEPDADQEAETDGDAYIKAKQAQGDAFGLCYFYLNQAILRYTLGDYPQALAASELVEHYLPGQAGMLSEVVFYFYDSLIRCAQGPDDAQVFAKVHENQQKMRHWADHAPMNFQHKYELVYAEEQRCLGDRLAAMDAYDRAIAGAKEHGYVQEQALANERAAQFYLDWGKEKIAAVYMQEAYDGYLRWGAKTKTHDLINDYAPLLQPILQPINTIDPLTTLNSIAPLHLSSHSTASRSPSAPENLNAALDLATLFKSAQALSESLDLNALLEKLAPMMLQASGAERLVLLFPDDDHAWQVRVTATAETTQLVSVPLMDHPHLPVKLIQYVQRTQEILVVDGQDPSLPADPYLQNHPRSMLCLPLLHQNKLNGLLYLEHHSVPGVFSRDRITVLNFLCTQTAIALENALLKQTLEQKLEVQTAKRQASETRLRNMVDNIPGVVYQARMTGDSADSLSYISPNCQTLYELSAQTMMKGQYSLRDFEHSEDKQIIDQMLAEANQTLQPFNHEFRIITPSGHLKWVQVISRLSQQPDGSTHWDGIVMDVSDRKQLEQEQDRLIQILQSTTDFIGICQPEKGILWQNQPFRTLRPDLKINEEQVPISTLYPEWAFEIVKQEGLPAAIEQGIWSGETALLNPSGEEIPTSQVIIAHKSEQGDVEYLSTILRDISDRKTAEIALQNSQDQFRRMTENVPGVIYRYVLHTDGSDKFTYLSSQVQELFEITPEIALQNTAAVWDVIHPDDVPRLLEALQKSVETLQPLWSEQRLNLAQKGLRWIQLFAQPERLDNGDVIFDGVVIDITDRKQSEEELRKLSERLELALDSANIGVWEWDYQTNVLTWDERMFTLFGVFPGDFKGTFQDWEKCVHPDDLAHAQEGAFPDQQSVEGNPLSTKEYRVIHPDGSIRHILATAMIQWTPQGQLARAIGVNLDITDRKHAERALQLSEARATAVFDQATVGVVEANLLSGKLTRFNHYFCDLLGYSSGELQNMSLVDLTHPDDVLECKQLIKALATGKISNFSVERRFIRKNGSIVWALASANRVQLPHDQPHMGVAILQDISDRKAAELALNNAQMQLRRLTENIPGMVFRYVLHPDGSNEFTYVSSYVHELYGMTLENVLTGEMGPWDVVHPEDLDYLASKIQESSQTLQPIIVEHRFLHPDKGVRWGQNIGRPKRQDNGDIVWHGVSFDITDRKAAELALQDAQAQFRRMTENVPGMIYRWVIRADGSQSFIYVSSKVRDFFELEPESVLKNETLIWDRIHPDDVSQLQGAIALSTDILQPFTNEFRLVLPRKGLRWVQLHSQPERLDNGDVVWDGVMIDISDRKHYEQQLQRVSDRLEMAVESAQIGIWEWNYHENHLVWDDQMFAIYGLPTEDFSGTYQDWANGVHPEDLAQLEAKTLDSINSQAKRYTQDYRVLRPDGSVRYILATASIERNSQGELIRLVGMNFDITDRKETELALQEAQSQFRNMTENVPGMLYRYVLHADGSEEMTYVSAQVREIFEVEPEHVLQSTAQLWDRVHPDDVTLVRDAFNLSAETLEPYHTEHRLILPQKGLRWVQGMARPERLKNGDVTWNGVVLDVSDRKQAERQLQVLSDRLELAVESAQLGIWEWDHHENVLTWDDRMFVIYGVSPQAFKGTYQDWANCIHPEDLVQLEVETPDLINGQANGYTQEFRIIRPDGSVRNILATASIERNSQLQPIRSVGINLDITDRKQAEAQLQRTNAELIRATHHKSAFLASMSHELRTPLNAVLGFSQLMQRDRSISDEHHEMLSTINRNGEYLLALINDILEMSKIEAGKVTLNPKPVDLPRFLDDIRETFKVKVEAKYLVFKVTHTPDIPRYIEADEVKLRQILLNLLSNALKFTQEGTISLHTQVLDGGSLPEKGHLQFTVTDTGPGIASEDLDSIFQAFMQSESGKQHHQGTGLGLPISRKFAQMMGGNIHVSSTLGQGSQFNCDIYAQILSADTEVEEGQPHRYHNIQGLKHPHQTYRLLIVDDNPDNRAVLLKMLSIPGFEVLEAVDGLQAVEMNERWQPHLICMDINMPQMDGLEATRQIRHSGSTPKIIAITANAFADDHQAALAAGCDDFLAKPLTADKVFDRLACLLEVEFDTAPLPVSSLPLPPSASNGDLIKDGFGVMPIEWQQLMHQAIRTLDDGSIRQLMADVPEAHAAMVEAISTLLKEFRYDTLMHILEIDP